MIKRYARIQAEHRAAASVPADDDTPVSTYETPDDVTETDYHPDADPFAAAIHQAVSDR